MSNKEHLKAMLTNIIHDKNEEAAVDFHNYLQAQMRAKMAPPVEETTEETVETAD